MTQQTVYLIRHGEVNGNILHLHRRVTVAEFNAIVRELPNETINERGIAQIRAIAPQVASFNLDCLYSSALLRARQTAEILAEETNLPIIIRDDLHEILPATLPGPPSRTYSLRGAYIRSGLRLALPWTRDTETIYGAFNRVRRAWQAMTSETTGNFAVVGHQGVFRLLFLWVHLSPRWKLVRGDTRNSGISVIVRRF